MSAEIVNSEKFNNEDDWKEGLNPWLLAMPTMFAAFMFVLDETIANVALPHMAGNFSVSRDESTWILTFYLVASGIMIPAVDWFCKLMGRKNFFMLSTIIFTAASVLCGFARSLDEMVAFRIIQGLGGGALLPISQAILLEAFPKEKRGQAMAMFGLVIVFAPILGPVVGGWITENLSWPWIFFINLPIGFLTVFMAKTFMVDPPYAKRQKGVPIDGRGFFYLTVWLVCLQIFLDKGNNNDWFGSTFICKLAITSVIAMVLFFHSQLTRKDTLVDLSVFKDKNYAIGTFVQVMIQAVLLASVAILPQFLQLLMGYDAFLSGLAIMPRGMGAFLSSIIFGLISTRIDNRLICAVGLALIGTAGMSLGFLNLNISPISIAVPNFIFGLGMGLAMVPLISLSVVTLKNEQMTNASGVQNLLKNLGGAIGTSIVTTLITRYGQMHQNMMVEHLNPLNPVYSERLASTTSALMQHADGVTAQFMAQYSLYGQMLKQANLWGFIEAFRIFGFVALLVIPLVFLLKKIK